MLFARYSRAAVYIALFLFAALLPLPPAQAAAPPAENSPLNLTFPTAGTTGAIYPLGAGICNLWNSKLDYVNATVQASNGGVQNLNLLRSGEAHVAFAVSSIVYEALHGEGGWKNRAYPDVRVLAGLYYNPNQVVARGNANISSLADFKGARFAPGAAGSTTAIETQLHFTALGFSYPEDIRPTFVGVAEASDLIRNRQIDGVWIMAGLPTASVTELLSTAGARLISIDEAVIRKLQAAYPWYSEFIIPPNTYENQSEPVRTTAIKMLLITDASLPDNVVYDLAKTFWENLPELRNAHPVMHTVSPDLAVKDLAGIPLHPGAERYYREIGLLK